MALADPVVEATSQLSRFHLETTTPNSKSVDLKRVTLTVSDTDLLADAHLQLKAGVRYGLVGRNGVGKSSLLRVVGNRTLIGFPKNVSVLYVEQEVVGDDRSVIQAVLDSDIITRRIYRCSYSVAACFTGLLIVTVVQFSST